MLFRCTWMLFGILLAFTTHAQLITKSIGLKWTPIENAANYKVEIASDTEFKKIIKATLTPTTEFEFNVPNPGIYYWRVSAITKSGTQSAPGPHSTIEAFLSPPKPIESPDFCLTTDEYCRLFWSTLKGIELYEVHTSIKADFSKFDSHESRESTINIPTLNRSSFFWKVRALSLDKQPLSEFSSVSRQNIKAPPPEKKKTPAPPPETPKPEAKEVRKKFFVRTYFELQSSFLTQTMNASTEKLPSGDGMGFPVGLGVNAQFRPLAPHWGAETQLGWQRYSTSFESTTNTSSGALSDAYFSWLIGGFYQLRIKELEGTLRLGIKNISQFYVHKTNQVWSLQALNHVYLFLRGSIHRQIGPVLTSFELEIAENLKHIPVWHVVPHVTASYPLKHVIAHARLAYLDHSLEGAFEDTSKTSFKIAQKSIVFELSASKDF